MEVCENKNRNNGWIRVIILIALGVLIAIGVALRVNAAEYENLLWQEDYKYYSGGVNGNMTYNRITNLTYTTNAPDKLNHFVYTDANGNVNYVIWSYELINVYQNYRTYYLRTDGSIYDNSEGLHEYSNGKYNAMITLSNGTKVYMYHQGGTGKNKSDNNNIYETTYYTDYYDIKKNNSTDALKYILDNKLKPDIEYEVPTEEMDIELVGFECNEYLEASWTGVTGISDNAYDELYVEVKPSYILLLEEGEQLQEFEKPDTINVPFLTYAFSNTYDYYFENNPYVGRAILTLKFTPVLSLSGSNPVQYRGKTIEVRFDVDGNYGGYDVPIGSLSPQYKDFEFTNFRASSLIDGNDSKILCGWDGFSVDGSVNYVYREVKTEIYCFDKYTQSWKWLEYPCEDAVYMSQGRMDLWMKEMYDYAASKNMVFEGQTGTYKWANCQIRITPYYKTYTEYVYGKSVLITTTFEGGIKSYKQSTDDVYNDIYPTYEDMQEDYEKDNSVIGDFMDEIINGGDGEGEELNLDDVTFNFFTLLKNLLSACGQFPALFAAVFAFLPDYFVSMLVLSFSLIIILRVIGR